MSLLLESAITWEVEHTCNSLLIKVQTVADFWENLFGNIYNIPKDMHILTEIQTVGTVANTCNPNKIKISEPHI